ncbi:DEAD/DEAH box helicase [Acinetobacter baumannii]|uniref:DEAD/DEAH box helicase n=1 Tax=Acinetobacter baumannii TaxID=470 RepID=UPI000D69498D|nr:AAA domain-containing protein [Acinetobacter baumannii]
MQQSPVEVLYNEIKSSKFNNDLIWLNAFNKNDDEDFFTDTIEKYITPFFDSKLWKNSYSKNTDIISEMDDFKKTKNKYSLYSKIISSANIIFTTTNSRIIEDLIHNKVQFDWSIMEESAKASGHELISPLLLSFKRVLIGDHKQLPPFSEKSITKILNPSNINIDIILEKITTGFFKNKLVYTSGLKNFIDTYLEINSALIKDQSNTLNQDETVSNEELLLNLIEKVYHPTIESTLKYYSLFKHLYSQTVELKKIKAVINFGSMINRQYRMHPQISKVVSDVFYDSDLLNNEDQEKYYSNNNRPFFFKDINSVNLNNKNRIIWIDIPEPLSFENKVTCFEKNYMNKKEITIIENILNSVQCRKNNLKPPSIAILSPYAKQVNLINNEFIGKGMAKKITSKGFKIFSETEIAKTVDSFQGGESDLVLVSLVKHNSANTIRAALGFLLDERRMNVLLSRAKHQLIIVGSLGMFKYWLDPISSNANLLNNYPFINHFVRLIENDEICSIIDCREIGVSLENY